MLLSRFALRTSRVFVAAPRLRHLCSTSDATVRIDTRTAPGRLSAAETIDEAPPASAASSSNLLRSLATQIRVKGHLSVKEFMAAALTHPTHGYYMKRDEVFGRGGDFVTSPELSAIFGELLGVWCVACWEQLGRPSRVRLLEAGPGRGTLMSDVLRSTAVFPGFHAALSVHLIEVSPHLRRLQRGLLTGMETEAEAEAAAAAPTGAAPPGAEPGLASYRAEGAADGGADGGPSVPIEWHASLEEVPHDESVAELVLAHEFLDALPVHQIVATPRGWRERMVGLRQGAAAPAEAAPAQATAAADAGGAPAAPAEDGAAAAASGVFPATGRGGGPPSGARDLEEDERDLEFVLSSAPTPASIMLGAKLDAIAGVARVDELKAGGGKGGGGKGGGGDGRAAAGTRGEGRGETVDVLGDGLSCAEISPGAISFISQLSRRIATSRCERRATCTLRLGAPFDLTPTMALGHARSGAALLVDYGSDQMAGDTLRGILGHRFVHPLHAPGQADLSVRRRALDLAAGGGHFLTSAAGRMRQVDVDFGTLRTVARDESAGSLRCPPLATQREFLASMGLEARVNAALRAAPSAEHVGGHF